MHVMSSFIEFTGKSVEEEFFNELYFLMHKNNKIALLRFNRVTGDMISVIRIFEEIWLPIGYSKSIVDLRRWWAQRTIPISRRGLEQVLRVTNEITNSSLLLASKGLSLIDHYWVKHVNSADNWDLLNFYENDFSDDIGDLLLGNYNIDNKNMVSKLSPSSSVPGEMKKKWVIIKEDRYLLKVNMNNAGQQCVNEVIASDLHKLTGFENYVHYILKKVRVDNEDGLGCLCKSFTSNVTEFISGYQLIQLSKTPNEISNYEFMIDLAERSGLSGKDVRSQFEYTIITDFLLTNIDRHFNNFGFLRESNSILLTGIAPIFDTGNSLFYNKKFLTENYPINDIKITSFWEKELSGFKVIRNKLSINLDKLRGFDNNIYNRLFDNTTLTNEHCEIVAKIYLKKLDLLQQYMNGTKIWVEHKYR